MNILAIDLGSSNVKAAISIYDGQQIEVLSVATVATQGVKTGKITSIDDASMSIRKAVDKVKENISVKINKVVVSVSGAYTSSTNGYSEITLERGAIISRNDISRALENAKISAGLLKEQIPIHVLPYRFKANNTDSIEDPLGMCASNFRLEANIITINSDDLKNINRILELADITNYELVSSIYANAIYCLNEDEKESGVAIVDCGAQVCDIAIYAYNSLVWLGYFPFGSNHITSDIAKYLMTSNETADKIKLQYSAYKNDENTAIEYYKSGSQVKDSVSIETVVKCVTIRLYEMLDCTNMSLEESKFEKNFSSVFLTGGCFKIDDISEIAFAKFNNKSVRIAIEKNKIFSNELVNDKNIFIMPEFTCLLGLCMYASGMGTNYELNSNGVMKTKRKNSDFSDDNAFIKFEKEENIDFSFEKTKEEIKKADKYNKPEQKMLSENKSDKDDLLGSMIIEKKEKSESSAFMKFWNNLWRYIESKF